MAITNDNSEFAIWNDLKVRRAYMFMLVKNGAQPRSPSSRVPIHL